MHFSLFLSFFFQIVIRWVWHKGVSLLLNEPKSIEWDIMKDYRPSCKGQLGNTKHVQFAVINSSYRFSRQQVNVHQFCNITSI